ncbi:flavodoxin domain-containing protein [Paenibacillus sp. AR247]|uniref:flavodoxin domain-containing protein n=1 Tax=Paenibacillus sp. AR247 TaxID=1631599 RepID=UPI0021584989|nr:flavodoxin domain-containing protein [Paenibacillus sp. AR247]
MSRTLVLYYSAYGHVLDMAWAAADGARRAGADVRICRIPELESERNGPLIRISTATGSQAKLRS